jgi:hypothetical protein
LTIGHSTRSIEEFIRLLEAHDVRRVIDVRTIPRSRHNPQFNRDKLSSALHRARIHYRHMPGLGGLRHARRNSTNGGWRNASFRGYADYMQTATFRHFETPISFCKGETAAPPARQWLTDLSDANADVIRMQRRKPIGQMTWHRIDASMSPAVVLEDAAKYVQGK